MKKIIFVFTLLACICSTLQATLQFDSKLRYRIVCESNRQGCLALGSNHGSTAILYYVLSGSTPEDGWWYFEKGQKGYTICNASNLNYIVYDKQRVETEKKGLSLTPFLQGDATEWFIEKFGPHFVIKSVEDPTQWFNLRYGQSQLMGTYPGSGTENELFNFYDELGRKVTDEGGETPVVGGDFGQKFDTLQINHKNLVYDKDHSQYYYSLPDSVRQGNPFHLQLNFTLKSLFSDHTIEMDPSFTKLDERNYTLTNPDCHTSYSMSLLNAKGEKVCQTKICFTYLPIVEINLDNCYSNMYNAGSIRVTDGNKTGYDSLYHATFKYRGNTSLRYDKKSFNIKLKDANGNPMDRSFFGLRNDNRWILDAMMIDKSCMRNRVSMELWNDFATPPYYGDLEPNARTGTRGNFVEVFWNNSYHGLFCMSERIDRKQINIKKFIPSTLSPKGQDEIHGVLYKGKQWSYEVFMGHHSNSEYLPGEKPANYSNQLGVEGWASYDIKYPDYEKEAVDWGPLYDAVNFVATSSQQTFDQNVAQCFDLPILIDYYLLMDIILASDNHGKNVYYFAYDIANPASRKLTLAPWDLDATWGLNWESSTDHTTPDWDLDEYIRTYEHGQNTLFIKLRQSRLINWKEVLAQRYAQLRPTFFYTESLTERFNRYADLFASSNADHREEAKWGGWHSDIQGGVDYIKNWIEARIETLDKKYGYDPIASSINEATADKYLHINGLRNAISITSYTETSLPIYSISGQLVRRVTVSEGVNIIDGLAAGIYIVNNQKVIVK